MILIYILIFAYILKNTNKNYMHFEQTSIKRLSYEYDTYSAHDP